MASVEVRIEKGPPAGQPGPVRRRAPWHLRANALVVAWLGLTVAVALAGDGLPAPRWLLIHVFLLGAVSSAILIWSEHFAVALLRARTPDPRWSLARLGLLNAAAVAVLYGAAAGPAAVAAGGAGVIVVVVVWHAAALVRLGEAVRARRPHTGAAWMLGAGVVWFGVALAVDVVVVAARPAGEVAAGLEPLVPLVVAGFVGQVLLGSLLHLLPAVLGGGPARFKENAALLERGWAARLAAFNAGVPLLALPVPRPLALLGWALVLAPAAVFVVLAVAALARAASAERVRPVQGGAGARGGTGKAVVSPAPAGVVAGCLLTAAAVVVAVTGGTGSGPVVTATGAKTVEVTLSGMRVRPAVIEAAPGTVLTLRVTNADGQRHDLRLGSGERTPMLGAGQSAVLTLAPLGEQVEGWCTVAGHRAAGMTMRIVPVGALAGPGAGTAGNAGAGTGHGAHGATAGTGAGAAAGTGLDPGAAMSPGWRPYDAALKPAPGGSEHEVEIRVDDRAVLEVAPGVRQRMWTFNGTVPGPVLRGKVGDVFTVTFVNGGTVGHGIDFHAGANAPDKVMRTIQPGQRLTYRFRAGLAGAWLYHCSTVPMTQHIASGMYGAVVIDPPDLARVDREYLLVQGELYLGEPGGDAQVVKSREGRPDGWMFNGTAAGYDHAPLAAKAGERVRIWAVAAGPSSGTALHVVGAPFDTLYAEGAYRLRAGGPGGAQVLDLAPAQGGFAELVFPEAGSYPVVDHTMRQAEGGAHGLFEVRAR
ncbi:nitrite reductase [Planomonospora sphaerica]|uniref:Copper-containing nitrite reductase n=1 Tax=Planomonospora sphaerica TaxID=161355 RepID=A0A161LNN0_9ACTN|nr:multicopper oxidase domain-containing protein [Planomonospora sphaerica]GAT71077.1 nitrite reductase [Planomonospora sphaerica]